MRVAFFLLLSVIALPLEAQDFAAAGRIENSQTGGTCSAALIGPDIIVTAGPCVTEENAQIYSFRSSFTRSTAISLRSGSDGCASTSLSDALKHRWPTGPSHPSRLATSRAPAKVCS